MATASAVRWAGILLAVGLPLFLVGAAFWKPAIYQQALPIALREMAQDRTRMIWIHGWMWIGTTATTLGMVLLATVLRAKGDSVLSTLAAALFSGGAMLWFVSLAFRFTVQDWAASRTLEIGVVPEGFEAWHRWAGLLYAAHMVSAYASWALAGGAVLATASVAPWLGWTGVGLGSVATVTFVLTGGSVQCPLTSNFWLRTSNLTCVIITGCPGAPGRSNAGRSLSSAGVRSRPRRPRARDADRARPRPRPDSRAGGRR